jgi:hypothetical protein
MIIQSYPDQESGKNCQNLPKLTGKKVKLLREKYCRMLVTRDRVWIDNL